MSKLKPYIGPHPTDHTLTEYYLKSEADKVIANRDYEIAELKKSIGKLLKSKTEQIMDEIKVRKWSDTEWHEPTVDYMGLEDK